MSSQPNILFLFSDQFRFDAIAAHGNPVIQTPALDRLVREGTTFTSAFSPSPVCVAARCSLHYGQYPIHTGCWANDTMPTDGRMSYVEALANAGYETYAIGKCHFTPDLYAMRGYQKREFQEEMDDPHPDRVSFINDLLAKGHTNAIEPQGVRSEMYYIPQPSRLPMEDHPTQWIGDRTVKFIGEHAQSQQPWHLFASFIHPHPPFAPPTPWHTLYRLKDMPMPKEPEGFEDLQLYVNKLQNRYKYRDHGFDYNLVRMIRSYYYSCVSFVDYQIGRIYRALEESGQLENTLILFSADHGELLGDYHCFGKRSMQDGAAHVPLILRGGSFSGGKLCGTPVSLVDVAPTLLSVGKAKITDRPLDGEDLGAVLSGVSKRKAVYSFYSAAYDTGIVGNQAPVNAITDPHARMVAAANMMCVTDAFKYIYSAPDDKELLFDRIHDPEETCNIMAQNPAEANDLRKQLLETLASAGYGQLQEGDKCKPLLSLKIPESPDIGLLQQDFRPAWFDFSVLDGYRKN